VAILSAGVALLRARWQTKTVSTGCQSARPREQIVAGHDVDFQVLQAQVCTQELELAGAGEVLDQQHLPLPRM